MKLLVSLLVFGSDRSSRNVFKRFLNGLRIAFFVSIYFHGEFFFVLIPLFTNILAVEKLLQIKIFSWSKDTSQKLMKITKALLKYFVI